MNQQLVEMGPILVLAGLSAGWLAETVLYRRGYGLVVDLSLGVGASLAGGSLLLILAGVPAGMLVVFVVGFALATGLVLVQRLGWPSEAQARSAGRSFASPSWAALRTARWERFPVSPTTVREGQDGPRRLARLRTWRPRGFTCYGVSLSKFSARRESAPREKRPPYVRYS